MHKLGMVAVIISVLVCELITIQALQGPGPLQTRFDVVKAAVPALLSRVRTGSSNLPCRLHGPGSFQELQQKGMTALEKYISNRAWVPPVATTVLVSCAAAGGVWFLSKAAAEVRKQRATDISESISNAGSAVGVGLGLIGLGLGVGLGLVAAAYVSKPPSGK